jgi:hypothetical protein
MNCDNTPWIDAVALYTNSSRILMLNKRAKEKANIT